MLHVSQYQNSLIVIFKINACDCIAIGGTEQGFI